MTVTLNSDSIIFEGNNFSCFMAGRDVFKASVRVGPGNQNRTLVVESIHGQSVDVPMGCVTNQDKWTDDPDGVAFAVNAIMGVVYACCPAGVDPQPVYYYSNIGILPVQYGGTESQWSSMPAALNFFNTSARYARAIEMLDAEQVRLNVLTSNVAGAAGSRLLVRYRTFASGMNTTPANWLTLGSSEVQTLIDSSLAFTQSGWIDVVPGARTFSLLALMGIGGNGSTSPIILNASLDIRRLAQ